ncbi:YybH family protein [Ornithinimicrobium faecis]|uniref:YybH family protein n=1 Tax=Ornithinimicrobium faecis TaxID=2934158 RepID=UPI00211976F0|nr:nuclear transport factor 2 family protein [Ornithinimicrobium sp. HY1745]
MSRGATPLATATGMLDALIDRDLDGVLECFDPAEDTYVYLEGPRWTNKGGEAIRKGWRDYFQAPIALLSWQWAEGPEVHESGDLGFVAGVIEYQFESDGMARPLRMRMTWVVRRRGGAWRILHEHGSQPLTDPYGTGDWLVPEDGSGVLPPAPA